MSPQTAIPTRGAADKSPPPATSSSPPATASHHNGAEVVPDPSKANILLVDDRTDKLMALEAVLSGLNQNLFKAQSGREALKILLRHDFAVILLDVTMPVMDGFETAAMIRRRASSEHTPIIFVTSVNASENHIAQGYSLGAVDYILSPIVPAVLKSKVSVFVELYKKTEQIRIQAEQLRRIEENEHRRRLTEAVDRLETETKRNRFFNLAADMLAISNFEGYMLQLNPSWEQTLGYTAEELKARPGLDFAHPDDRTTVERELMQFRQGGRAAYCEARFQHKDGSYRWLGWTAAPFPSEQLVYIFARDITAGKEAAAQIQTLNHELRSRVAELTEVNGELEAFNYSISHDLRAPLRSMQGFARALIEDEESKLSVDGADFLRRIVSSSGYMDNLLHDLLEYSRLSRTEMALRPVVIDDAVAEILGLMEKEIEQKNARMEILAPLGSVQAHPATFRQIIANLVGNALKFISPARAPRLRIWTEARGESLRLFVEDNGIGIDPEHHRKIFGLFERLHGGSQYAGTGIGLAIVRKGAERMGGSAGVESAPGEWSRFWVELPVAK